MITYCLIQLLNEFKTEVQKYKKPRYLNKF